jgi:hypothetical protein
LYAQPIAIKPLTPSRPTQTILEDVGASKAFSGTTKRTGANTIAAELIILLAILKS